jgi:hypothetical protein
MTSMIRWSAGIALLLAFVIVPFAAFAQEGTLPNPDELGAFLLEVARQVAAGNWSALAALAIVGAVFLLRTAAKRWVPWLATDVGGVVTLFVSTALLAVAAPLYAGTAIGKAAIVGALSAGLTAAGGWASVRKVLRSLLPSAAALLARIPGVGPFVAKLLALVTPAPIAPQVQAEADAAYKSLDPAPTATQADAQLFPKG